MNALRLPTMQSILQLVEDSAIASYPWKDRGVAPSGYTKGLALAYAHIVQRWTLGDPATYEMAQANTHLADTDALSWYAGIFAELGMRNNEDGLDTLRHLFVLLMGLGMRESSGQHCCGRDMSADNVSADTAEAGAFQMSWNMRDCSPEMQRLFDDYSPGGALANQCALAVFCENVTCDEDDWHCYGDDDEPGYQYQRLAKICPQFAVETAAIGLRKRRKHWGPIVRYEAEVRVEADDLFKAVQYLITEVPSV